MWTSQLSKSIYYIGVNDRTSPLFESMWPLPYGVSYNSYLIVGDSAVAIIDGVETAYATQHIESIRQILGDRQPDYLVINHMEPDHSGSIGILRQAFPDITIVGNSITHQQVKGFYGIESDSLSVKDGDTIDLGGISLHFFTTPMVHWPETMMTLCPEEETLFSGDAFGCFGALDGAALDSLLDTSFYFPEMIRYYSNIVAKYGRPVQNALAKLSSIKFSTVCPTHGPVWREQLDKVVNIYDRLSRYQPIGNGAVIVYGSMYGNTRRMAEAAARELVTRGIRPVRVINAALTNLSDILAQIYTHPRLILAAPTYSDGLFPPMRQVVEALAVRGIPNHRVAILGGHTWNPRSIKVMEEILSEIKVTPVTPSVGWKHAPKPDDIEAARAVAAALAEE